MELFLMDIYPSKVDNPYITDNTEVFTKINIHSDLFNSSHPLLHKLYKTEFPIHMYIQLTT